MYFSKLDCLCLEARERASFVMIDMVFHSIYEQYNFHGFLTYDFQRSALLSH